MGRYILLRGITISATIFFGIFLTVLIANKTGQIDQNVRSKVQRQFRYQREYSMDYELEEAGLNLPYWPRHLRWTINSLTFDWGKVIFSNFRQISTAARQEGSVAGIIQERLPKTLLLVGTGYFFVFIIGIPLALYLSRNHNSRIDKLISSLAPISSIPSWVHGVLLIMVIGVELRLLPFGGMYGRVQYESDFLNFIEMGKHMLMPVMAIVLSLLFQLVYTWRTFFLINADEDYVSLGISKGLNSKTLNQRYILRPALPFIITSFSLTLVTFWQMMVALEVVFDWPGIGTLYVSSLPNFFGESMTPGEMVISVAIVVLFAYFLGLTVLILDVFYVLVDPRLRLGSSPTVTQKSSWKTRRGFFRNWGVRGQRLSNFPFRGATYKSAGELIKLIPKKITTAWKSLWASSREWWISLKSIIKQLSHYPSAWFGGLYIAMLIIGSLYALIILPYEEIGNRWFSTSITGNRFVPKLALPEWTNIFRKGDLLSSIVFVNTDDSIINEFEVISETTSKQVTVFSFDYSYTHIPEETYLQFDSHYDEKRPFVSMTWKMPNGREIELKNISIEGSERVKLSDLLPRQMQVSRTMPKDQLFSLASELGNPELSPFFTVDPLESQAPINGEYVLEIEALFFEEGTELDIELVILGQVYGVAGTDFMRRDLLVPLLWGMPFALVIGIGGAFITTILAMIISATGVWFGGWLDGLIQRITEANMILPIIAISVLLYALYGISLWAILGVIVLLNIFSSPTKVFRAAFLQIKESPYIEAAKAYGASDKRIIFKYMLPRISPVFIPQLVVLIPSYVFLEATMGMFNIKSVYPTWGKVIYEALRQGAIFGSRFWILQPLALLLLTGLAFALLGFALEKVLNPSLQDKQ